MSWTVVIAFVFAVVAASVIVLAAEVGALSFLKLGTSRSRIVFALLSLVAGVIFAIVSVVFVVALYGIGLFVALDKGYDSGEKFLTAGVLAFFIFPLGVLASRTILFRLTGLGSWGKAALYAVVATAVATILISIAGLLSLSLTLR